MFGIKHQFLKIHQMETKEGKRFSVKDSDLQVALDDGNVEVGSLDAICLTLPGLPPVFIPHIKVAKLA